MSINWKKAKENEEEYSRNWQIDTVSNLLNNLEMLQVFVTQIDTPWNWKWASIAAHQALYTALIAALSGTAPTLTVIKRDVVNKPRDRAHQIGAAKAWQCEGKSLAEIALRLSYPAGGNKPCKIFTEEEVEKLLEEETQLIDIYEALRRMRSRKGIDKRPNHNGNEYLPMSNSRRLEMTADQSAAVDKLIKQFRNEFEHFVPKTWVVDASQFPLLLLLVLEVIRFITLQSNCITYRFGDKEQLQELLDAIQESVSKH